MAAFVGADAGSVLEQVVRDRVRDLVGYQDVRYARRYAELVESVRQQEARRVPGSARFTETVAHYLYKLMAYKDEYEVARLALDPQVRAGVEAEFGEGAKVAYQLHPPILRALGMDRKISLGPWFVPIFRVLRGMRRVRHTPFDVFGYAHVRRLERGLIDEYIGVVTRLATGLDPDGIDRATAIAALPDRIRGYEHIKVANVESYRAELQNALQGGYLRE